MSLEFMFSKRYKRWQVVGPIDEVRMGALEARRSDGTYETAVCYRLSAPYVDRYTGEWKRFGYIQKARTAR